MDARIYKYFRGLLPAEYVTFKKTEIDMSDPDDPRCTFECDMTRSTYDLGVIGYQRFLMMVSNEEIIYQKDHSYYSDVHQLKTGGCDCGAWVLPDNTYLHNLKCPKYRNPFDGSMPESAK